MALLNFFIGLTIGCILNVVVNRISQNISNNHNTKDIFIIIVSGIVFLISFLQFGYNAIFIKAAVLNCILIIASFIDYRHQIIPNKLIMITIAMGGLLFFIDDISLASTIGGMLLGGGILFLLALIPKAMGGGDIKFMFALGLFLGTKKVLAALLIAFMLAAIISILLLLFRVKGRKDHIPFGPFLAVGSFISFHFYDIIFICFR